MGKLYMNEELFGSDDSKDIKYDNSTSQIEADNVQGAIDYILENGTGNSSDMELTYAEYLKLSDEEKHNGTNYFIKDLGSSSSISCSNAEKGVIIKNGVWYCGGNSSGSGGGENEYKTLLSLEDGIITAPSSGTQYTQETILQEFTLQDDINNYDQILIKNHVGPHYWNNQADLINESILYPKLYDGSMFTLGEPSFDDVNYYILMQVSIDKNKLKVHFNVKNNFDYSKIEIFGVKFNGGASGSSQKILAIDTLYSEEEKIVGKWIDGKPIYQKTYSNNGSALTLPIDVSNLNIDKLVNWEAACSNTQEYGPIMWTIDSCSGIDGRSLYIQDNQIKTTGSYYRHFITIQFTKTTDEENSFTYDMIDSTEGLTDEQLAALASETIAAAWPL